MHNTFWKVESIISEYPAISPMGATTKVTKELLHIPKMRIFMSDMTFRGYETLLWEFECGVLLHFKDEPEFGRGGVFSIQVEGQDRIGSPDFFRLYVQASELLGVTLMMDGKGFVSTRDFRRYMIR